MNRGRRRRKSNRERTDASAGWRAEYALAGAEFPVFEDPDPMPMDTRDCDYCDEWHGPTNQYPMHLPECDGVDSDAGGERTARPTLAEASASGGGEA